LHQVGVSFDLYIRQFTEFYLQDVRPRGDIQTELFLCTRLIYSFM
jgi:hypothetical protein